MVLKFLLVFIALFCYGSSAWGAFCFFRVVDHSGKLGKQLIGSLAGVFTIYAMYKVIFLPVDNKLENLIALLFYSSSVVIYWAAVYENKAAPLSFAFSDTEPNKIKSSGPYKLVRHPFYLSYIFSWLAMFITAPNYVSWFIFVCMSMIYLIAAKKEEACFLNTSITKIKYQHYINSTGMFLPRLNFLKRIFS